MCQTIASIVDNSSYMTTNANEVAIAKAKAVAPTLAPVEEDSLMKIKGSRMRILICSESVPPQVNGIARRVGMYADGLRTMGCNVGKFYSGGARQTLLQL
jgi:hypothetical protein